MTNETTLIILDDSVDSQKKDFHPSRLFSQLESLEYILETKKTTNTNKIGVLTVSSPKSVLIQPSNEIESIFQKVSDLNASEDKGDYLSVINFAADTLINLQNKQTERRIILFIAGEITNSKEEISNVGLLLKEKSIKVDLICLEDNEQNQEKLQNFLNTLNTDNKSHLLTISPKTEVKVKDQLIQSKIFTEIKNEQVEQVEQTEDEVDEMLRLALEISMMEMDQVEKELNENEKKRKKEEKNKKEKENENENEKEKEKEKEIGKEKEKEIEGKKVDEDEDEGDPILKNIEKLSETDQLKYVIKMSMGGLTEEDMKEIQQKIKKVEEIEKKRELETGEKEKGRNGGKVKGKVMEMEMEMEIQKVIEKKKKIVIEKPLPVPQKDPKVLEVMKNWGFLTDVINQIPGAKSNDEKIKNMWEKILFNKNESNDHQTNEKDQKKDHQTKEIVKENEIKKEKPENLEMVIQKEKEIGIEAKN
ncbi:26s proteasome non-atpase regulatory subunit 4 [Anaeramoeba flamelloides]|uniref:26s proteasome non-atpase regulatory subunit 4 n=1 Tax=Anaeramoeba flamelloides TaxID=1746091 RepID=A0ABQ8YGP4_9EUKA|nr:26s proteasome non-atpase regulatory subunit 4 [Anaeramoeba flamelloides]